MLLNAEIQPIFRGQNYSFLHLITDFTTVSVKNMYFFK